MRLAKHSALPTKRTLLADIILVVAIAPVYLLTILSESLAVAGVQVILSKAVSSSESVQCQLLLGIYLVSAIVVTLWTYNILSAVATADGKEIIESLLGLPEEERCNALKMLGLEYNIKNPELKGYWCSRKQMLREMQEMGDEDEDYKSLVSGILLGLWVGCALACQLTAFYYFNQIYSWFEKGEVAPSLVAERQFEIIMIAMLTVSVFLLVPLMFICGWCISWLIESKDAKARRKEEMERRMDACWNQATMIDSLIGLEQNTGGVLKKKSDLLMDI